MNLGIYIHIPFCQVKCSYCHFISFPYEPQLAARYNRALIREIDDSIAHDAAIREADSIYFGGGTPSLVPANHIEDILKACGARFRVRDDCEVTLEANPGTIARRKIAALRKCGINRISLGAQSFDDRELAAIGRLHSADMILEAFYQLKAGGYENINLDLMLGLPLQTRNSWKTNLETIARLGVPHISVYMLDLDDQCPLREAVASGSIQIPEEDLVSDLYLETIDFLSSCGYLQYEISNFARPGHECRHNMKYWLRFPFMGLGLGSHSFDGKTRYANTSQITDYLAAVEAGKSPTGWRESIGIGQSVQETLFLGLRLTQGLDLKQLKVKYGQEVTAKYLDFFRDLSDHGLVIWKDDKIKLTAKGMLLSNEIFQQFV